MNRPVVARLAATIVVAATAMLGLTVPAAHAAPTINTHLVIEHGKHSSDIGTPTAAATIRADGVVKQAFTKADMYWTPGFGTGWVAGVTRTLYNTTVTDTPLGAPLGHETCTGSSCRQWTTAGDLYRSGSTPQAVPFTGTPTLTGVVDFRDVAGTGRGPLVGTTRVLQRGQVYRSGNLTKATTFDRWMLGQLGITDIYDLRTSAQRAAKPTPAITGIAVHKLNLTGDSFTTKPWLDQASATASMTDLWTRYVTDATVRANTADLVKQIAAKKTPVLIMDDDGTSRVGYAAAVIGFAAGESGTDAAAGYKKSNTFNRASVTAAVQQYTISKGALWAAGWQATVTANPSYLNTAIAKMTDSYQSVPKFLTAGLQLTEATKSALGSKLLSRTTNDGKVNVVEANVYCYLSEAKAMQDVKLAAAGADVVGLMEVAQKWAAVETWARANGFIHVQDSRESHGRGLLIRKSMFTSISAGTELMHPALTTSARTLVWATVRTRGGKTVTFGVTHAFSKIDASGHPSNNKAGVAASAIHFRKVADWAAAKEKVGEVILVGDLNVNYRADTKVKHAGFPWVTIEGKGSTATSGLRSNFTLKGLPSDINLGTHKGRNRLIDYQYVWVGKGHRLYLDSYQIVTKVLSDHAQVRATYHFGTARTGP